MKKRKPTKSNYAVAKGLRDYYEKQVHELKQKLAHLQHQLDTYKRAEKKREEAANWAAFDRCSDQTTSHEVELFAASPQYQRYREWRRESYGAEEGKRVDAIKYLHARGRLKDGDWMAP